MSNKLGRLQSVNLRAVWNSEAGDFTPWLAGEENLALLGDTIGLDLELDQVEKGVGPFRADIVCKDTGTNSWVLIENQLERTDHSHLGQLLTYAAGLDAVTIVWIADRFTDEHRAALDWLNEVTDDSINFFGLEIELWRIGDSPIAPKFNIVSKPNDWIRTVSAGRQPGGGDLSPLRQMQLEYWTAFRDYLHEHHSSIKTQKPFPQHWENFAIGRSNFLLAAIINTRDNRLAVQLVMTGDDSKAHFHLLQEERAAIEAEIGKTLEWRELPKRIQSDIMLVNTSFNPSAREQWPRQHAWLGETLETFHRCFAPRVKVLNADDYVVDDVVEPDDDASA